MIGMKGTLVVKSGSEGAGNKVATAK
jgi:hypothetical protein